MGPLDNAAAQESLIGPVFAIAQAGSGQFVYRIVTPEKLYPGAGVRLALSSPGLPVPALPHLPSAGLIIVE